MFLRTLTMSPSKVNKMASLAVLPLMAFAILIGSRAMGQAATPIEAPREGTLVVGNLRSDSLTLHRLGGDGTQETLTLGASPHELLVVNGRLYITAPRSNRILEVDSGAPGVLRTIHAEGQPHGIAAIGGDGFAVSFDTGNDVRTYNARSLEQTSRFEAGTTPHSVAAFDGWFFVTDSRDNLVRRIDSRDASHALLPAGELPESITIAGTHVVTADAVSGTLSVFDAGTFAHVRTIETGGQPVRVIAIDERTVAVALSALTRVHIIDVETGETLRRIRVPARPDGLCLSPSGDYLAVVSNASDLVQVFRSSDWKLVVNLATGDGPGACAWLPE